MSPRSVCLGSLKLPGFCPGVHTGSHGAGMGSGWWCPGQVWPGLGASRKGGCGVGRYVRKRKLGVVAVDSGCLVVVDPSYVSDGRLWPRRGREECADFWGADAEEFRDFLGRLHGIEPEAAGEVWRVRVRGKTAEEAAGWLKELAAVWRLRVVCTPYTGSAQDAAYDVCSGPARGGQLCFPDGRPGLAVAFAPGIGDGLYEVWAYYREEPGWGERVARVELRLL